MLSKVDEPYSAKELLNGFIGKVQNVTRIEGGHKGFDHEKLVQQLSSGFEVLEVTGLPFSFLPLRLNFSVGILCKAKYHSA